MASPFQPKIDKLTIETIEAVTNEVHHAIDKDIPSKYGWYQIPTVSTVLGYSSMMTSNSGLEPIEAEVTGGVYELKEDSDELTLRLNVMFNGWASRNKFGYNFLMEKVPLDKLDTIPELVSDYIEDVCKQCIEKKRLQPSRA